MKKRIIASLIALMVGIAAICGCAGGSSDEPKGTDIVASIGNESINYALYNAAFESYLEYMTQMGGGVTDQEDLETFQDMIMDYLLMDMMTLYNAAEDGFALSDEEKQAAIDQAKSELKDIEDEYMKAAQEDYEKDSSKTIEQYFNEYIAALSDHYLGKKMNFEQYSEAYTDELIRSNTIEAYKAYVCKDFQVSDADISNWYDEQFDSDQAAYDKYPEQYKFDAEYFEKYFGIKDDACPPTYIPKGYSRIMDIVVNPSGKLSDEYESKQKRLEEIYKECSDLTFTDALNGDDANAEKIAELIAEYKQIDQECEAVYNDYIKDAKKKIDAAYDELVSGKDFADVMMRYSENTDVVGKDGEDGCEAFQTMGQIISLKYECNADWSDTVKEIFGMLKVGEYSGVFADEDGSLHIIKYVSDVPAGAVPLESVYEPIKSIVKTISDETAWNELIETWLDDSRIKRNMKLIRLVGQDLIEETE